MFIAAAGGKFLLPNDVSIYLIILSVTVIVGDVQCKGYLATIVSPPPLPGDMYGQGQLRWVMHLLQGLATPGVGLA